MIDELDRELAARGVPSHRRRRIRLELEDHLACDPSADLGDPVELARQFADELGTVRVRHAAISTFLALVPLGVLVVALFASLAATLTSHPAGPIVVWFALGVQLAFVGGTLGLLRAWRLRRAAVIPAAEARVLLNRAVLGVAGGALTVVMLAAGAYPMWLAHGLPWIAVGVGTACLLLATTSLARAARVMPRATGTAHDLGFDLGIPMSPWRLALVVAGGVAFCIALVGVVQSDPLDGLIRAVGDGTLCLAGFALLGRPLGLRRQVP